MILQEYRKVKFPNGEAYIRIDSMQKLANTNSIIFDCDGVLVDASKSYNKAIIEATAYLLSILLGEKFPKSAITEDVIFAFRRTGGFNNDWNTTYSLTMFVMSRIPEKFVDDYKAIFTEAIRKAGYPYSRLKLARELIKRNKIRVETKQQITKEIIEFAAKLDVRGLASAEREIFKGSSNNVAMLKSLREFLQYPEGVGKSIITSVFDENFYGNDLFEKVHGIKARLNIKKGTILNEEILVKESTLAKLKELFGKSIGIATGRGSVGTFFTLGKIRGYLNSNALIFLEDIDPKILEEKKYGKPEPYALIKASEAFPNGTNIMYVGDSAEDLIMAKRANKTKNFIFAAVCGNDSLSERRFDMFTKEKADIIIRSVNDLPAVFESVRN